MPRAIVSPATAVLNFFKTASMDTADLVLGLSRDAVRERHQRADTIRDAQQKAAKKKAKETAAVIPAGVIRSAAPKKAATAKAAKRRGPKPGSHRKTAPAQLDLEPATVNDDGGLPDQGDQTGLDDI